MPEPPPQGPGNTEARLAWLEKQATAPGPIDLEQLPWAKLLAKLENTWHPNADALFDGSQAFGGDGRGPYQGPWSTVLPTPGSPGTNSFNIPIAGTYLLICAGSAFSASANQDLAVQVFIDGIAINPMRGFSNEAASHKTLVPSITSQALAQGTHIVAFYTAGTTTSNSGDWAHFGAVRIG